MNYPKWWHNKSLFSNFLVPFSWIYYFLGVVRTVLVTPISLPVKVICIGNISVGGTGKTQVAKWLSQKLTEENIKPVVISKGYGGDFHKSSLKSLLVKKSDDVNKVGDEAKYLSQTTDVIITKNPSYALDLITKIKPDVIILDDFLQNPYVAKDFSILVIDADRMWGNNRLFPAGPLRQSLKSIQNKIGLTIAIGSEKNPHANFDHKAFFAQITLDDSELYKIKTDQKYIAFAGIGNPCRFFNCLKQNKLNVIEQIEFQDHHQYLDKEVKYLKTIAKKYEAKLITTPKDATKLKNRLEFEVFIPKLNFINKDDEAEILSILLKTLSKKSP